MIAVAIPDMAIEPRRTSAAAQSGDHHLFAEPRRLYSSERVDRRPARCQGGILCGDRDLRHRIRALRLIDQPADDVADARRAGVRRGDDDAGRSPDPAAQLSPLGIGLGDELDDDPGDDRADRGADRRRLPDDLLFLARDLLSERSDRHRRFCADPLLDRQLPGAGANPVRSPRLCPCRGRARLSRIRDRKSRAPDPPRGPRSAVLSGGLRRSCWSTSGMRGGARIRSSICGSCASALFASAP